MSLKNINKKKIFLIKKRTLIVLSSFLLDLVYMDFISYNVHYLLLFKIKSNRNVWVCSHSDFQTANHEVIF
jgi:hypothetical protein